MVVEPIADGVNRGEELSQALEGVVLALDRDEDGVACRERVHGKQAERRRTVDQDRVVGGGRAKGLAELLSTVDAVRDRLNDRLEVLAIVLTMEDRRNRLSEQVADEVRSHFPELVARARIPRTVRLAEAPSHGLPISLYDPRSAAATAYDDLAGELSARMKQRTTLDRTRAVV